MFKLMLAREVVEQVAKILILARPSGTRDDGIYMGRRVK